MFNSVVAEVAEGGSNMSLPYSRLASHEWMLTEQSTWS